MQRFGGGARLEGPEFGTVGSWIQGDAQLLLLIFLQCGCAPSALAM